MTTLPPAVCLDSKYDLPLARDYQRKHRTGLRRRLTHWRENQLARRALQIAGNPRSVLDMPCGAGRFWPMLAEQPERRLLAGDNSPAMLEIARASADPAALARFETVRALDAFALDLPDNAVEHVLCMRLLHHFSQPAGRLRILGELYRVASRGVTVSLWVDGNRQAQRRARADARREQAVGWWRAASSRPSSRRPAFACAGTSTCCPVGPCGACTCWTRCSRPPATVPRPAADYPPVGTAGRGRECAWAVCWVFC